mmetsp:Transcript_4552/g.14261  ORF Transcript_4552/g.14261 Transcript_4552/m.14261 type:complete len:278 (-) Transcript_4552:196-1029(-)|eukprot:CAMPEP_0198668182 /NCGR_PEP_ID=MMETSP1467-20131203/71492_1 /TAXON_ID=1462469 /ORGANISM="unid. sp., Strain CCMP2135" /LENGTH=277 /DNA_ID=CAMNT_0044404897 /DNA_START=163 /DNA_END=999 /DNA_ORIENTATION=-
MVAVLALYAARQRVVLHSSEALCDLYAIPERPVETDHLERTVRRHLDAASTYDAAKPVAGHTLEAFRAIPARGDVIVDAGCGRARSTQTLARRHPDHLVLGVDRSAHRLGRVMPLDESEHDDVILPDNALLVRAELGDFWRLLARRATRDLAPRRSFRVRHTTLFYPNPSPKREHLKRRWHGHPAFPWLLTAAGDGITLRASWRTYLDEFAAALHVAADHGLPAARRLLDDTPGPLRPHALSGISPELALSHFEAKYVAVDLPVYELRVGRPLDLPP